jgi:hypothetical protein
MDLETFKRSLLVYTILCAALSVGFISVEQSAALRAAHGAHGIELSGGIIDTGNS